MASALHFIPFEFLSYPLIFKTSDSTVIVGGLVCTLCVDHKNSCAFLQALNQSLANTCAVFVLGT